jgi:hypothetical protein
MSLIKNIINRVKLEIAYRKKIKQSKEQDPYIYK